QESLDAAQRGQRFSGGGGVGQLDFPAEIEPLHDLLGVRALEVGVVGLGDGRANQLTSHEVSAFHLAFIFKFEFAVDCRQPSIDIAYARDDMTLFVVNRAPLGV